LVKQLEAENAWWRDTAQRLLVERQDRAAVSLLVEVVRESKQPVARSQALFTLDGLSAVADELVLATLQDPHPRVREGALRLAEGRLNAVAQVQKAAFGMANDLDARVRLQLALSLGECEDDARLPALVKLADTAVSNRWSAMAVRSSVVSLGLRLLQQLANADGRWLRAPDEAHAEFLELVAGLIGAANQRRDASPFFALLTNEFTSASAKIALLAGYANGLKRGKHALRELLSQLPSGDTNIARSLQEAFALGAATASSAVSPTYQRLMAVRLLANAEPEVSGPVLLELLRATGPDVIQAAAARGLAELADPPLARTLFESWDHMGPAARRKVLAASLNSPVTIEALVTALEQHRVLPAELEASTRDALRRVATPTLKPRLDRLLKSNASGDRKEVVQRFAPALTLEGDRKQGAELFCKSCLVCHALQGQGQRVGPDVSGANSRPIETLLTDILDPSRDVSPDFISYELTMTGGETLSGLIATETAGSITLRRADQPDETILRSQIKELRASGKSIMPDGLEQGLTAQDIADLLAFLRQPEVALLPAER
jgi:putative heme-binding domain-containing protein